ncbi:pentatricopeptide repeat-containing protein [Rosa sericea]
MNLFSARKIFTLITSRNYTCTTALHQPPNLHHFLQLSITQRSLPLAQQSHARVLTHGLQRNPFTATKLISAYALFNHPTKSRLVFDSIEPKNVYLWNSLINGHVKACVYNEAFKLFVEMCCCCDALPDEYTFSTMAKVSGEVGDLVAGKWVHGKSVRVGFVTDTVVANSLMSMYCKCGEFGECRKVFDEMPERNVGSWNVLIAGCGFDNGMLETAECMMRSGLKPDGFTVSSLLGLCGGEDVGELGYGRELHCYVVKYGLDLDLGSDVHLGCCLVDMYCRSGRVDLGRRVFERIKCRNVYAWTAMVNGYVQNGASDEGLILFWKMQVEDGVEPNRVSLVSVLPACISHAGLTGGKQIHGFAIRKEMNHDVSLCNALIDMYCKCGSLDFARRVFEDDSFCKDAISWSSMISGYGLHGRGEEAIVLYNKMLQLGIKPDMITIVGVLSACGRSGLVNEGLSVYSSATTDYGIKPTVEICACVVDLLSRSGELDRALNFIKMMPVEPGPSVWGALVTASVLHGNRDMQDLAYKFLIQLEPENPSNYISASNFHASSRRWDVVAETRTMMKDRGLKKTPGCSWISITGKTHSFYVADKVHPCCDSIYEMLDYLILVMKGAPDSNDLVEYSA